MNNDLVWESLEARGLKEKKRVVKSIVVLEQINDGGESVANLFVYFPERNGKCDKQFNNF